MDAVDIIIRRTGISADDAEYYEALAHARIASYLGVDAGDVDFSQYMFQVADIGVLSYQQDQAVANSAVTLGYTSHSFSEGGVSESIAGATGQAIWEQYAQAVDSVLATLGNQKQGVVRFI